MSLTILSFGRHVLTKWMESSRRSPRKRWPAFEATTEFQLSVQSTHRRPSRSACSEAGKSSETGPVFVRHISGLRAANWFRHPTRLLFTVTGSQLRFRF